MVQKFDPAYIIKDCCLKICLIPYILTPPGKNYENIYIEMKGQWCDTHCQIGKMVFMATEMKTCKFQAY